MGPEELCSAEVSLQRQKRDMELRHEAETQSLYMAVEEDIWSIVSGPRYGRRPRRRFFLLRYTAGSFPER